MCAQKEQIYVPLRWCWFSSRSLSPVSCSQDITELQAMGRGGSAFAQKSDIWTPLQCNMQNLAFGQRGVRGSGRMILNQQISKNEMWQLFLIPIVLFWVISWSNFNHIENEPASSWKVPLQISDLYQKQQAHAKTFTENTNRKTELMLYHIISYVFTRGPFSYDGWIYKNKKFGCRNSLVEWRERLLNCLLVVIFFHWSGCKS